MHWTPFEIYGEDHKIFPILNFYSLIFFRLAFSVELNYTVYPDLPLVRKTLSVVNCGKADIKVEAVNVEDVALTFVGPHMQTMRQYGRYRVHGTYIGDWNDPLVVLHEMTSHRGLAVGNETAGVVKRTAVHEDGRSLRVGVTMFGRSNPLDLDYTQVRKLTEDDTPSL